MKRMIITAVILLMAGATALLAQEKGNAKGGPMPKSKGEAAAVNALIAAQQKNDNDGIIAAAENLVTKYKDTEFKATALFLEALAYQKKGDQDKYQVYLERTLTANPNHYQAALSLAEITLQGTREHDLDRDDKLAKADKYANTAIQSVNGAAKPNPNLTDQEWEDAKKDIVAESHDALGLSALERKNYNQAISEFKMAVDGAAHPQATYQVRLASAYQQAGQNDEAITLAEKVMNDQQAPPQVRSVAQAVRAAAVVAKNGGKPLTPNNPPPQVQINKQN